jgi:hypothetical protein
MYVCIYCPEVSANLERVEATRLCHSISHFFSLWGGPSVSFSTLLPLIRTLKVKMSRGASTIRAFSQQERFIKENHSRIDNNHRAFFYMWVANRWLAIRVDFVGSLVTSCSALSIVIFHKLNRDMDAGLAGLSLSYALVFSEALLWVVR